MRKVALMVLCLGMFLRSSVWASAALVDSATDSAPTTLLDAYHQGKRSNCGSVALTKLIIAKYGASPVNGPFARTPNNEGGFSMLLVDGTRVVVTPSQLAMAESESGFSSESTNSGLGAANALYAVMAVRRAGKNDGQEISSRQFKNALKTLGGGGDLADADVLPFLLGFRGFQEPSDPQQALSTYMVGSGKHIAFATNQRYDEHGENSGEAIAAFSKYYGTPTMYRYALANSGDQMLRQCSDGSSSWSPATTVWRSCRAGEVTELERKRTKRQHNHHS